MAEPVSHCAAVGIGSLVSWCGASYRLVAGPTKAKDAGSSVEVWLAVEVGRSGHERRGRAGGAGSKLHAIPVQEIGCNESTQSVSKAETKVGENEAEALVSASGVPSAHAAPSGGSSEERVGGAGGGDGAPCRRDGGEHPARRDVAAQHVRARLTRALGCSPTFALTLIALLALLSLVFD